MMDIQAILQLAPVIPVLVVSDLEHAAPLARALCKGGLRVLEITLRTPCALEAITAMRAAAPDAIVGAGTLTRPEDFAAADKAGAQFGVSPGLTPQLVEAARTASFPLLPGAMTPSEVMQARQLGFSTLKLFPAQQAGGVAMLKALGGPLPDVRFCPTGGITLASAPSFLALSNVLCVGGSWVAPPELLAAEDWRGVETLAREAAVLSRSGENGRD